MSNDYETYRRLVESANPVHPKRLQGLQSESRRAQPRLLPATGLFVVTLLAVIAAIVISRPGVLSPTSPVASLRAATSPPTQLVSATGATATAVRSGQVTVQIDCYGEPETVTITNKTNEDITLDSIGRFHKASSSDIGTVDYSEVRVDARVQPHSRYVYTPKGQLFEDEFPDETVTVHTSFGSVESSCAAARGKEIDVPPGKAATGTDPDSPLAIPRAFLERLDLEYIGGGPPEEGSVTARLLHKYSGRQLFHNEWALPEAGNEKWTKPDSNGLLGISDIRFEFDSSENASRFLEASMRAVLKDYLPEDAVSPSRLPAELELGEKTLVYETVIPAGSEAIGIPLDIQVYFFTFTVNETVAAVGVGGTEALTNDQAYEIARLASAQVKQVRDQ